LYIAKGYWKIAFELKLKIGAMVTLLTTFYYYSMQHHFQAVDQYEIKKKCLLLRLLAMI